MVVSGKSTSHQRDNYHLCIGNWLSNRTFRNFLGQYSEGVWTDVVKTCALLGIYTLQYKSVDGEGTVWSLEDLEHLVEFLQHEKQFPEELSPSFLRPLRNIPAAARYRKPDAAWRKGDNGAVFRPRGTHGLLSRCFGDRILFRGLEKAGMAD